MLEIALIILVVLITLSVTYLGTPALYNKIETNLNIGMLIALALVLFAGFRVDTADTNAYMLLFEHCPDFITMLVSGDFSYLINVREEGGYLFFNALVKIFTDLPQVLFLIIAIIAVSLYFVSIKTYSVIPIMSLMLYFTNIYMVKEMAQIRQGLAMAIAIFAIRYLIKERFKKFLLCILIASLFHKSILVFLILYPFRKIKINYYFGMLFLVIISILLITDFADNILFYYFGNAEVMARLMVYMNSSYLNESDMTRFYEYLIVFVVFLLFNPWMRQKIKYYDIFMTMLALGLIFMAFWHAYPFFGDRFAAPMWSSLIFLLPGACLLYENKIYKLCCGGIVLLIAIKVFSSHLAMLGLDI